MKPITVLLLVVVLATACVSRHREVVQEEPSQGRYLVLYYSLTGGTRQLAEDIATLLQADTAAINVATPYDGSYEEVIARCLQEQEADTVPPLIPLTVDINDYDAIFLGYPIWFGTYARPIMALLKEYDFANKTIIPFCTFGSGGLGASTNSLREACPDAIVIEGYGVRMARLDKAYDEVQQFLINSGYLVGDATEVPRYSPQEVVTDSDKLIFDEACGSYPMPIGVPETVGKRTTTTGIDYLFTVRTITQQGDTAQALVYITHDHNDRPIFTRVER